MIRQLLLASRPLSWVNTAYPFALTYLLLAPTVSWAVLVVGTLFFLVPYNLAMYGPFLVALVALGDPASWIVLGISVFAVIAYSVKGLRFKERPVLDSLTSSTHFVSPAVFAAALAGAGVHARADLLLVAFFCWGMASHAFGAVQDIPADRAGGIASIATVFGARATARFAFALYLAGGVLAACSRWPTALAGVFALPYLVMVLPFLDLADADAERANRGWRRFLAINYVVGFLVTLLAIASVTVPAFA